jgi:hypothetical protein
MRLAPALCALLALAPPFQSNDRPEDHERPLPLPTARVDVQRGRILLVEGEELVALHRGASRKVRRSAHLEGGTRSEVEVTWPRLASVRVRGSASFGFEPDDEPPFRPVLSFLHFASVDVEVRRGSLGLILPQGWTLSVGRAAIFLRELPDGSLEIHHRGGQPVEIWSRIERDEDHPERIVSGTRLRLPPAPLDEA